MNPPAGWHPDPSGQPGQRYYDGQRWTEHFAPPPAPYPYPVQPIAAVSAAELDRQLRAQARCVAAHIERFRELIEEAEASEIHLALGFLSWPAYVVDVVGGAMPKLRFGDRRELVAVLAGIGWSTVNRDLVLQDVEQPEAITGLDGKIYPKRKPKPTPDPNPQVESAETLHEKALGLSQAVREFLAAMKGVSPRIARMMAMSVLGDANATTGALDALYDWIDTIPGAVSDGASRPTPLEAVGLRVGPR